MKLPLHFPFIFRHFINFSLKFLDLIRDNILAFICDFDFTVFFIVLILQLRDMLFQILLQRFVMNQNFILQTCEFVYEWKKVFVHELFAVIQLNNIIKLRTRHKPIMILINLLYRQLYRFQLVFLCHYFENLLFSNRQKLYSRPIKLCLT